MDEKNAVLRLRKDELGRRGVFLYEEDILLLKQLLIHRSMRATTIHEFYQSLSLHWLNRTRNKNGITNRLGKLKAAGILVQHKVKLKGSYYLYYYVLGSRGVGALEQLGFVNDNDRNRIIEQSRKFSVPSEHTEAMSHIANQIYLKLFRNESLKGFHQARGSAHVDFGHSSIMFNKPEDMIVPDWVFSFGDTIVCLEVDTGTQRQRMIEKKYESYIKHSKRFIDEGKKVLVVFSVVDDSIFESYAESRDRRIRTLKQLAPPFKTWINQGELSSDFQDLSEQPPPLQFYAVRAKQTARLIERLVIGTQPFSEMDRYQYVYDWMRKTRHVLKEDYEVDSVDKEDFFLPRRDRLLDCDLVVTLRRKGRSKPIHYAVIYGEEGSVITHQLIEANGERLSQINEAEQPNYARLLVCYDEQTDMLEDVYGKDLPCEMWQTDSASWVDAMNEGLGAAPDILYVTSQFKKEWRRFSE